VHEILVRQGTRADSVRELLGAAAEHGVPVRGALPEEIAALAHGATHGGVLAIASPKPLLGRAELTSLVRRLLDERAGGGDAPLLLLLEGVDDARNLGSALRSADAFGAHAVILRRRAWDFDPVEVARPASGAYERLPIAVVDDVAAIADLQEMGLKLVGCIANVKRTLYDASLDWPVLLAVGGEKRGLSNAVRSICDRLARIPTRAGTSLSLSHAAAVVLAEAARQRMPLRSRPERA
jgi:23S rRNA (guanosine2251-2'-O)-methyltransferase